MNKRIMEFDRIRGFREISVGVGGNQGKAIRMSDTSTANSLQVSQTTTINMPSPQINSIRPDFFASVEARTPYPSEPSESKALGQRVSMPTEHVVEKETPSISASATTVEARTDNQPVRAGTVKQDTETPIAKPSSVQKRRSYIRIGIFFALAICFLFGAHWYLHPVITPPASSTRKLYPNLRRSEMLGSKASIRSNSDRRASENLAQGIDLLTGIRNTVIHGGLPVQKQFLSLLDDAQQDLERTSASFQSLQYALADYGASWPLNVARLQDEIAIINDITDQPRCPICNVIKKVMPSLGADNGGNPDMAIRQRTLDYLEDLKVALQDIESDAYQYQEDVKGGKETFAKIDAATAQAAVDYPEEKDRIAKLPASQYLRRNREEKGRVDGYIRQVRRADEQFCAAQSFEARIEQGRSVSLERLGALNRTLDDWITRCKSEGGGCRGILDEMRALDTMIGKLGQE